jgi:hypothetical protein
MLVVITGPAEADLEQIADYISAHNPARALSFVRELRDKCEALGDAPRVSAGAALRARWHPAPSPRQLPDLLSASTLSTLCTFSTAPRITSRSCFARNEK